MGVTAGVNVDIGRSFFAGIWGGYEWVSDTVDVKVVPNTLSVDASGYTAGTVLGYRFGAARAEQGIEQRIVDAATRR